jgi:hypothetical protein
MNMNIRPTFRFQFGAFLKGAIVMFLIMAAILTAFMSLTVGIDSQTVVMSFSGYGFATMIFMFVMGIVNIRSDLRISLQFGVSRRTSFICEVLAALSTSVLLAVAGEVMNGIAQAISADRSSIFVADLYQLIYVGTNTPGLSVGQHIMSILFNTGYSLSVCLVGMFFSLLFWRLSKFWTIVAALCIPVVINGGPILLYMMGFDLIAFGRWIAASPINAMVCFVIGGILTGIIDWLLLRKANILAAR